MRSKFLKAFILALVLAGLGSQRVNAGFVVRTFYSGLSGTAVTDLTTATGTNASGVVYKIFPDGPNRDGTPVQTEVLSSVLEGTRDIAETFGSMIQGYLEAPQTGNYFFYISSDDSSELWLSTNANPALATRVSYVSGAVGKGAYTSQTSQKSAAIALTAGQILYFQAIHKEGTGGDHVAVGWDLPDGTQQRPIPAYSAQPYPMSYYANPSFLQDVKDITVDENQTVTFSCAINGTPTYYQWYREYLPLPMVSISGAIVSAYTLKTKLSDNNSKFQLVAGTTRGMLISRVATLKVNKDVTKPTISSISSGYTTPFRIQVNYSEPVDGVTALDPANYAVDNGLQVYGVQWVSSTTSNGVYLYTSAMASGTTYTLTVNNIKDLATTPNVINANSTKTVKWFNPITYFVYTGVSGGTTNDALNSAKYKAGIPNSIYNDTSAEHGSIADNYVGQMRAYLVPPTTGDYTFYIAADDAGVLFLSTDENPANKRAICGLNTWVGNRTYLQLPEQKSAPITLQAGQRYYIEAMVKEATGGDQYNVTWQKPGDAAIANNAAPIAIDYLQPYTYTPGPVSVTKAPQAFTAAEGTGAYFTIANPDPTFTFLDGYYIEQRAPGPFSYGSFGSGFLAYIDGSPNYSFQWYKSGAAISGATGPTLYVPNVSANDNNVGYTVLVKNNFSMAASANAILTVIPDTTAPTVQAVSFFTNLVSVIFNKNVTAATATNAANYVLTDSTGTNNIAFTIASFANGTVNLAVTNLVQGGTYKLKVSGVKDATVAGNTVATTTLTFEAFAATLVRVNNTQTAALAAEKVSIEAGGADIWGTDDGMAFGYFEVTGNFDFKVKLDSITRADAWSKAGIMARVSTDQKSRNVIIMGTPRTGQNTYSMQNRMVTGAASNSDGAKRPVVTYPNTWLRLERVGSIFRGYRSTDGVNWTLVDTMDTGTFTSANPEGAFPAKLLVGLAVTSHTTSATTKAYFTDFGRTAPNQVAIGTQPVATTAVENRSATFSVTPGTTDIVSYQWQRKGTNDANWVTIAGATGATYTAPSVTMADNGSTKWRVIVYNSTTSATSSEVTVTVQKDTVAPTALSATALFGGKTLVVRFDESMNASSAATAANYTFIGYRGTISAINYRDDVKVAVIDVNLPFSTNVVSTVRIGSGVKDLAGNAITLTNLVADIVQLKGLDVGTYDLFSAAFTDPVVPGANLAFSARDFEVTAGGSDIWNTNDGFRFVYKSLTGDFDVRARVESLKWANDWTKAGLMARVDTNAGSINVSMIVDPAYGANLFEVNYRGTTDGASAAWPGSSTVKPVTYPNAWVRLIHINNQFYALRSSDGNSWVVQGTMAADNFPDTFMVGMVATAHNNVAGTNTIAQFRDFQIGDYIAGPKVASIVGDPSLTKVTVTFAAPVTASSGNVAGNYVFDNGLTVTTAQLDSTGTILALVTSAQTPGALYNLTMNNMMGLDGNLVKPNSKSAFVAYTPAAGVLFREVWKGIGSPLTSLTSSARYPRLPDVVGYIPSFEAPANVDDTYSQRISGFIIPTNTGAYTFFIAANDQAQLWLSTTASPANKALIASVANGTAVREWNKETGQKSAAINLVAGQQYYVEVLHAAGTGVEHVAVAWTMDGSTPAKGSMPIGRDFIGSAANPYLAALSITKQPANVTTVKFQPTSFSVDSSSSVPAFYQWQKKMAGSTVWFDVDGATAKTYNTARVPLSDNGAKVRCVVSVPGVILYSDEATMTINDDTVPPVLISATGSVGATKVTLIFSEKIDAQIGGNRLSYIVFGGYSVIGAELQANHTTVILTLDPALTESQNVWAYQVVDEAGNQAEFGKDILPITLVGANGSVDPTSVTVRSAVNIERQGKNVVISWPASFGSELKLHARTVQGLWTPVDAQVQQNGDKNSVTLPIDGSNKLYRLTK